MILADVAVIWSYDATNCVANVVLMSAPTPLAARMWRKSPKSPSLTSAALLATPRSAMPSRPRCATRCRRCRTTCSRCRASWPEEGSRTAQRKGRSRGNRPVNPTPFGLCPGSTVGTGREEGSPRYRCHCRQGPMAGPSPLRRTGCRRGPAAAGCDGRWACAQAPVGWPGPCRSRPRGPVLHPAPALRRTAHASARPAPHHAGLLKPLLEGARS